MSVCASSPPSLSLRFLHATGLPTLLSTPLDVKLLILTRFIRLFAFGSSTLILASYLSALGITDSWIGFFMTATAIGDSALGFIFTFIADAAGRRAILMVGAAGMVAAGLVFATLEGYWVLLGAAVMGVISARCVFVFFLEPIVGGFDELRSEVLAGVKWDPFARSRNRRWRILLVRMRGWMFMLGMD